MTSESKEAIKMAMKSAVEKLTNGNYDVSKEELDALCVGVVIRVLDIPNSLMELKISEEDVCRACDQAHGELLNCKRIAVETVWEALHNAIVGVAQGDIEENDSTLAIATAYLKWVGHKALND